MPEDDNTAAEDQLGVNEVGPSDNVYLEAERTRVRFEILKMAMEKRPMNTEIFPFARRAAAFVFGQSDPESDNEDDFVYGNN